MAQVRKRMSSEETVFTSAVASVTPPTGVRLRRLALDTDFTGDPAVRVVYGVSKKVPLPRKRAQSLASFSRNVANKLWDLSTERIPYVTFEDVK